MLRRFEHNQVYHPDQTLSATGAELGRRYEDVSFTANDGVVLNGWFYPASTNSPRGHLAILICHGNAGNIGHRLPLCEALLATGASVFVFDYRGYGQSQGRPSEEGTYCDAQAAHAWLQKKGFSGEHILPYGESLGGGIVSELALRERVGGVVLQGTFTSIPDIGAELFPWLPVRWLARIKYNTLSKLPRLKVPVLVMHSRADDLVRFHHSQRNFAAANEPKLFWELTGDHGDPLANEARFIEGIEKFLQLVEKGSSARPTSRTSQTSLTGQT